MDITASTDTLPIWVVLIALLVPLVIAAIGLIASRKKADKIEIATLNKTIGERFEELEKRMRKCEKIRDFLLDKSSDETKKGLEIYLKLSE